MSTVSEVRHGEGIGFDRERRRLGEGRAYRVCVTDFSDPGLCLRNDGCFVRRSLGGRDITGKDDRPKVDRTHAADLESALDRNDRR